MVEKGKYIDSARSSGQIFDMLAQTSGSGVGVTPGGLGDFGV
jgi:hypothetical protein